VELCTRMVAMKKFSQALISSLSELVEPARFSTRQSNRELHLHDISPHFSFEFLNSNPEGD
jgi:hypothetical protein